MNKYPCELIEDLMPLYIENEISDQSKAIIEEHLESCTGCQNLLQEYSNSEKVQIEIATETLPYSSTFKKTMKRLKTIVVYSLIAVFIMGISIGGLSYYVGLQQGNNQHLIYAKTEQDVLDFYYKNNPGLKRAEDEGKVQFINKAIEIPEGKGILHLDRIWYTDDRILILYDIEGEIPTDAYATIKWENGNRSTSYYRNLNIGEGIVYEGKYFSVLNFGNTKEKLKPTKEETYEELTIGITLRYGELGVTEQQINTPETMIKVAYSPENKEPHIIDLNGKILIGEFGEIIPRQIIMGQLESFLTFDFINQDDNRIQILAGTLKTDKGDERKLWIPLEPTGLETPYYKLRFDTLDNIPSSITLAIEGIKMITDQSLEFDMDVRRFHNNLKDPGKLEEMNQLIGNVYDVDIYLSEIFWDSRGLYFAISQDIELNNDNPLNRISATSMYTMDQQERANSFNHLYGWRLPNVLEIFNKNNEPMDEYYFGASGGGQGESVGMSLHKDFIESTDRITIKVYNLTHKIFGKWINTISCE